MASFARLPIASGVKSGSGGLVSASALVSESAVLLPVVVVVAAMAASTTDRRNFGTWSYETREEKLELVVVTVPRPHRGERRGAWVN